MRNNAPTMYELAILSFIHHAGGEFVLSSDLRERVTSTEFDPSRNSINKVCRHLEEDGYVFGVKQDAPGKTGPTWHWSLTDQGRQHLDKWTREMKKILE